MMKFTRFLTAAFFLLLVGCSKKHESIPPADPPGPANELPVIFHVLYENPGDALQNPPQEVFTERLEKLNRFYAGTLYPEANSAAVPVSFAAAQTDPYGRKLEEPGIHRVYYAGSANMDADEFLYSEHPAGSANAEVFWNPNRYINIWIFGFRQTNDPKTDQTSVTGIAFLPYAPADRTLDGLSWDKDGVYLHEVPNYMHGIAFNNLWFTDESDNATMHEIGHYLGLRHTFAETDEACADTDDYTDDFCSDTPKYDRKAYEKWFFELPVEEWEDEKCYMRTSFSGQRFRSVNVMDYYQGDHTSITPQQRSRIAFVMAYSPLIPRPWLTGVKSIGEQPVADRTKAPRPISMR